MTKTQSRKKKVSTRVKKILVPIDFSAAARAAFQHALDLAAQSPAEIILLHVVVPSESVGNGAVKAAKKKLDEFCQSEGTQSNRCKPIVRAGIPFFEITQSAKDAGADLIILGRRDQRGVAPLGEGHTVDRVARYATCPVLLVRETDGKHPESR